MMKTMMCVALSLFCISLLPASYIHHKACEHVQPDGTRLSLFMTGDEFYHRVYDEGDHTIVLDPESGFAVYAVPDGSSVKASQYVVGQVDPIALNIPRGLKQDPSLIRESFRLCREGEGDRNGSAPTTGTINNIFIFLRFDNQSEFGTPIMNYEMTCNSTTFPSLKGYFKEESEDQLTISSTFYPSAVNGFVHSYQDSHNRNYFLPFSASNTIGYTSETEGFTRLQTMMRSAVAQLAPFVSPGMDIDGNEDGKVDNVTFLVKGDPDALGEVLWPHWWTLNLVSTAYIYGKQVWDYNLLFSETLTVSGLCHEMSHTLGFPELCHYPDDGMNPVGPWDLMSSDEDIPPHHLAYMKWKYGQWFDAIPELSPTPGASTQTLASIASSPFACYKVPSNLENQYYVIEYRRQASIYENSVPASGLLVYRVIEDVNGNTEGPPDEGYIYRPNGTITVNGMIENANFSSSVGRAEINSATNPAP